MKAITQVVLDNKADLGIIFDTDVDRSADADSTGCEFNRNRLIALMTAIVLEEVIVNLTLIDLPGLTKVIVVQLHDLVIPDTNFQNELKGLMVLACDVFDLPIRKDIIHCVVRWQLAKRQ
ncbi:unnamed protein product [Lactuca saligna]|uniref:Uncharacterized protein n=1 Tax=Lactuca saligna TaxID=75948 RepID=A0AA36DYZ0_LACSI|nr:unnamed protein product [Lactuca saligna]